MPKNQKTLEEMNAAKAEADVLAEHQRRLNESKWIGVRGSNAGNGIWNSDIPQEDYEAVKDFLATRWGKRIKELKKITG
jgi:hypothetical protein